MKKETAYFTLSMFFFFLGFPILILLGISGIVMWDEDNANEGVIVREECEAFCQAADGVLVGIEYDRQTEGGSCLCEIYPSESEFPDAD